jgi:hypothetical protein
MGVSFSKEAPVEYYSHGKTLETFEETDFFILMTHTFPIRVLLLFYVVRLFL